MNKIRIDIPYGKGMLPVAVPEDILAGIITPEEEEAKENDPISIVRGALEKPIGSEPLFKLARGKNKIVIITSDHTRPMPSGITLPLLVEEIFKGNPQAEITVLIATGMHRAMTENEIRARFGEELMQNVRFRVHDSRNDEAMADLGFLPSGGRLLIDRDAAQCDLLIAEGFIEPHFFAGFSGGRKSVLPGIASYKTIMYNHNAAFIADPAARQGNLEGNPIHRDMLFAARKAKLAFILNVLLDKNKRICKAFAGDLEKAHLSGCEACLRAASVETVPADIVITSNGGNPLDQNLYQSVKGMTAAESCVRPGGTIIMCAEGIDGHGGQAFVEWFSKRGSARETMEDILRVPAASTSPDQWQSQILARILLKADCIFVTRSENKELVESMFMTWAPDVETALETALKKASPDARVCVIPNGVEVVCR